MRMPVLGLMGLTFAATAMPAIAATRPFPVPGFTKLRIEGPYMVHVRTGAGPSVNARGPQSQLDKLTVESRGDLLVISTEKGWNWTSLHWGKDQIVTIDVTVPMLQAATLTGSGDVNIDHIRTSAFAAQLTGSGDLSIAQLETSRLSASVNGSGDLTIAGRTGRADASVQGSGDLRASGLAVGLLNASVTGSGDISIGATKVAKANIVGSGDISIAGRPSCTKNKVGSGDIRCGG